MLSNAYAKISPVLFRRISYNSEEARRPAPAMEADKNKKTKNVLIISSSFPPHIFGGAEIAAYNKAKMLVRRGYNVSVVTVKEKNDPPAWGELCPEGFRLYRIQMPRYYTLFERPRIAQLYKKFVWHFQDYFDLRNRKRISAVLDDARPDHVEVDNLVGFGFNILSEIGSRGIPVAYVLHDLNLVCFNTGMIRSGKICNRQCFSCGCVAVLRQKNLEKITRLGFISPSHANLERAKKYIPAMENSLSCVIRNVPEEIPKLPEKIKPAENRIQLLYVGRLHPVKGIEFLLRVLESLSVRYNFKLTVLGTGPSEQKLRKYYSGKSWVSFLGFVPRGEVAAALQNCDLYCIPSLVAESYGLVTAQALQLGRPVIGSNAGGTAELVRDGITGMLVAPGNESAWREAFEKIFSRPELLAGWHKNAALFSHEFNEETIGMAYEKFIGDLIFQPEREV